MNVIRCGAFSAFVLLCLVIMNGYGQRAPAPPRVSGSAGGINIQGRIYLPNGQPIQRSIRVELRGVRSTQTADSDSSGSFSFRVVGPGSYTVNVDAGEEFETVSQDMLIDDTLADAIQRTQLGKSTQISVYLKPKKSAVVQAELVDAKLAPVPPKALDHYRSGRKLSSEAKLEDAITEFRKAVELFPAFHQAYLELGKVYLKLSRFDDSVTALRSALSYENNYEIRLHLGMALLNQKKFAPAEEQLIAAANLDKSAVTPEYYIGVIKYETTDFDGAMAAFEKATKLNGNRPFPYLHKYLAGVYIKKNKWALAATELETYLSQAPDAKDAEKIRTTIAELRSKPN